MCLMWCHVQRWVVDNDLPCDGCAFGQAARLPSPWACATCRHGQGTMCALTREAQPLAGRCCHWQVVPRAETVLVLGDGQLAPWLRGAGGIAAVFAASPTAPPLQRDAAGQVVVALEELSVPLVYGVAAAGWDAALGWDAAADDPVLGWEPPLDAVRQQAISALLDALEAAEQGSLCAALTRLHAALDQATAPLPSGWARLLADLLVLGQERAVGDADLLAQLATVARAAAMTTEETRPC